MSAVFLHLFTTYNVFIQRRLFCLSLLRKSCRLVLTPNVWASGPGTKWELLMCSLISDCSEGLSSEHRAEMSERRWSLWARLDKSHESFLLLSHSHLHFYTSVSVQRSDTSCSSEPELWAVNHLRSESEADVAVIYKYVVAACNFHLMWVLHKLQLEHFRFWRSHKTCHCITDESFHQWWSADKTHVSV